MSAPARRRQVAYATSRGVSARRACALLQVARSTLSYASKLAKKDAPVLEQLQKLASQYSTRATGTAGSRSSWSGPDTA